MIQAVLLSSLGVSELDSAGYSLGRYRDDATGLPWLLLVHAEPGGDVTGQFTRLDPGTMGRTLFHFRAKSHDGRYRLEHLKLNDAWTSAGLPPLPALCAFVAAARTALEADRAPDLETLVPLHLKMPFTLPPVEVRPGDREIRLEFYAPDDD